ncbi:hypothetical protein FGO68_gene16793 [Halteria grandinella]|uniref:Uncharacterized protein n=1 Tax=Halteria grandinella TaxID=5974 RepID=A0A8J8T8B6_HALGN|nr:hypothetical protein FGO68_gene16793 [Halteria grandinella]
MEAREKMDEKQSAQVPRRITSNRDAIDVAPIVKRQSSNIRKGIDDIVDEFNQIDVENQFKSGAQTNHNIDMVNEDYMRKKTAIHSLAQEFSDINLNGIDTTTLANSRDARIGKLIKEHALSGNHRRDNQNQQTSD